jgi:hypothetical protein
MSEFYLSHENPSIRSINKLLRDNQTKSVDNAAAQWIEEMKKVTENIRALQKENEESVLNNLKTYIEMEQTIFQQKAAQYQNLKNEITRLRTVNKAITIPLDQTLQTIKNEHLGNDEIQSKIIDIEIILFRLNEKTNKTLETYLKDSGNYNENNNNSNSNRYQFMIEKIGQLNSLYKEDDKNEVSLFETLTQIQGLSKMDDEEKRNKQTEILKKRLNSIQTIKQNIIKTLHDIIEKSKDAFYSNYLKSLAYLKCIEMEMIQSISKMKLNSKEECETRDIQTEFDNFKINTRSYLSKKIAEYNNQILKITQKQTEVSKNNSETQISELRREIDELRGKISEKESEIRDLDNKITGITTKPSQSLQNGIDKKKYEDKIEKIRDTDILQIDSQIKEKEKELNRLQSGKRGIEKKTRIFGSLLTDKQTELKTFEDKGKSVSNSMGKAYILINRVNNFMELLKKKKDEMDKKKSNNRLLQSMQNDMLYKEVNSLLSVKSLGDSRYKLVIGKSAKDFKKRISVLKKYFEGKNKFYENRNSILSALTFNINSVVSAFTNETPKNLSFNNKNFADIFTSNKPAPSVQPTSYNQGSAQSAFGSPSPSAYSPKPVYPTSVPQQPTTPMGYMGYGGASEMNAKNKGPEKKSLSSYEFITILDKVFEDLTSKVRSNEVYENRLKVFLKFLDQRDRELNEEILAKLNRVEKINKPEYEFLFPAQIRFITRRVLRIKEFMETPRNNSQMKHVYMTDFILMYFSLHYILSNFLDLILKPQAFNEMNS